MRKQTIIDLRNKLDAVATEFSRKAGGDVADSEVIAEFRARHAPAIKALSRQLEDMALGDLLNQVGARKRPRIGAGVGPDLFGEYPGVPKMISLGRHKRKNTLKASFAEADLWLTSHEARPLPEGAVKNPGFRKLLDDLRPFAGSSDYTIEQAMERRLAQKSARGASTA